MISHLRANASFFGNIREQSRFVDGSSQRLLGVATNPEPHSLQRDHRVHMVWGANVDDVDFLAILGEQFAIVCELFSVLEFGCFALSFEGVSIDVAHGDHVTEESGIAGVTASFAADANAGDVEFFDCGIAKSRCGPCGYKVTSSDSRGTDC